LRTGHDAAHASISPSLRSRLELQRPRARPAVPTITHHGEESWRAGGHVLHVASTLGQLNGIPLDGVKAYITGATSVQELIDMPYPAEELAKVCAPLHLLS
jgi:hypothetical protein